MQKIKQPIIEFKYISPKSAKNMVSIAQREKLKTKNNRTKRKDKNISYDKYTSLKFLLRGNNSGAVR